MAAGVDEAGAPATGVGELTSAAVWTGVGAAEPGPAEVDAAGGLLLAELAAG